MGEDRREPDKETLHSAEREMLSSYTDDRKTWRFQEWMNFLYLYIYICVCVYVCMYVCMYVCIYVYKYNIGISHRTSRHGHVTSEC